MITLRHARRAIVLLSLIAALRPAPAAAEISGPWPPALGAYFWAGVDGSGNGDSGDWANSWFGGRYYIEGDGMNPPVTHWLPAEDGDFLRFIDSLLPDASHHSIALGSHDLPSSGAEFQMNASFSGGSLNLAGIGIANVSFKYGETFPLDFNGTQFITPHMDVTASKDVIDFNNVEVDANILVLTGNYQAGSPLPVINFKSSTVHVDEVGIARGAAGLPPSTVNFDQSQLEGLGVHVGTGYTNDTDPEAYAELRLTNSSSANIAQFVIVGEQIGGRLTLDEESELVTPTGYVDVGGMGVGNVYVTNGSLLQAKDLQLGLQNNGGVAVDEDGRVRTENGYLGAIAGYDGTVNLESGGSWITDTLQDGYNSNGYVYVRDGGYLGVSGDAVLGRYAGGYGRLFIFGSNNHIDAEPTADVRGNLWVGYEGYGDLWVDGYDAHLKVGNSMTIAPTSRVTVTGTSADADVGYATYVYGGMIVDGGGRVYTRHLAMRGGTVSVGGFPGGGAVTIGGRSSLAPAGSVQVNSGGTISGVGTIIGKLIVNGPDYFNGYVTGGVVGLGDSDIGQLNVDGDIQINGAGILGLRIAGQDDNDADDQNDLHDVVKATGSINVQGTVLLSFEDGYSPAPGDVFTLFDAASLTMNPTIMIRNLAPGWLYSTAIAGGKWTITSLAVGTATDPLDFNFDGSVNADDLAVLVAHFGKPDGALQSEGDADADFDVDGADLLLWQQRLGGSPGILAAAAPVPEPNSAVLGALGLGALLPRLRSRWPTS